MRPLASIKGIGPQVAVKLAKLGIQDTRGLLFHFPRAYEDLTHISGISDLKPDQKSVIEAKVLAISHFRTPRKKMFVTEAILQDRTGQIKAIWFNQPYLHQSLKKDETYIFIGTPKADVGLTLPAPAIEKPEKGSGLLAIYPETSGITSRMLRHFVDSALDAAREVSDPLPAALRKKYKLMELSEALINIHQPKNPENLQKARTRLATDELITIQLFVERLKARNEKLSAPVVNPDVDLIKKLLPGLPFELTPKQKIATWEIIQDMDKSVPMQRLLEGDVGSGKTIVAGLSALEVMANHYQAAIMAPTEVLAYQHYEKFCGYFGELGFTMALLTGAYSKICRGSASEDLSKADIANGLKDGSIDMVIGTHALIQQKISFKNLALAIIDEQHRFGVNQREALIQKGSSPHLLSLTATPIPRSLALTVYGDLQLSVLDEKPADRKPVNTSIMPYTQEEKAFQLARKEVEAGRQVFVVVPLVEMSEKLNAASVEERIEQIRKHFKGFRVESLHGKMKSLDKTKVMEKFSRNEVQVLVSTTVIEVGIDIPNATVMVIENPERFGLAQLHQLRGRVGRGEHAGQCILLPGVEANEEQLKRLQFFAKVNDGFKLAEYDLKTRGPGNFFTTQQSGFSHLHLANIFDLEMIKLSQEIAGAMHQEFSESVAGFESLYPAPDQLTSHQE